LINNNNTTYVSDDEIEGIRQRVKDYKSNRRKIYSAEKSSYDDFVEDDNNNDISQSYYNEPVRRDHKKSRYHKIISNLTKIDQF